MVVMKEWMMLWVTSKGLRVRGTRMLRNCRKRRVFPDMIFNIYIYI